MPIAELVLDSSPSDFESFYFKATDQRTSLVVLVASRDQFRRLIESAGGSPGLYVLQAEDSTVYVGQSIDLAVRLRNHKTSNKIGYRRVMLMMRDQNISRYLDYGEAKLYQTLSELGYRLEQSSLSSSLNLKKQRLASMDPEYVVMADELVRQFLSYGVALGLTRPLEQSSVPLKETTCISLPKAIPLPAPVEVEARTAESSSAGLQVITATGDSISGASATEAFILALEHAGLDKVASLGYFLSGEPLVSAIRSEKYPSASKQRARFFVMTHSNTDSKKKILRKVSDALALGWTVL